MIGQQPLVLSDDFWFILTVGVVAQGVVCGALSSILAEHKGYSSTAWFAWGFFFSALGLIAAAGLPLQQERFLTRTCNACAEPVRIEARRCKHCGEAASPADIDDAIGALIKRGWDWKTRQTILFMIDRLPDASQEKQFMAILALREAEAGSQRAAGGLLRIGTTPAIVAVFRSGFATGRAAGELQKLADPALIPMLIQSLQEDNLRNHAEKVLRSFGKDALPQLLEARQTGSKACRKVIQGLVDSARGGERRR